MEKPDWEAIRREYEKGCSTYQELATKYGVPKTTLLRRSQKWTGPDRTIKKSGPVRTEQEAAPIRILRSEFPSPPSAIKGASLGLNALVEYLEKGSKLMDLADHVKAANALSQYNRIIVNAPPESGEEADQEDFSGFTDDELRLYIEFQERAKKRA